MSKQERKFSKGLLGRPVLVLNADYKPLTSYPLSLNTMKKTIKSVLKNRVIVLEEYDDIIITDSTEFKLPKVVVLKKYINVSKTPKFSRHNVYLRDDYTCQYCGTHFADSKELTFDHVIPRCKGGITSWDNIVTSCRSCNSKKGGKLLEESKMSLYNKPTVPTISSLENNSRKRRKNKFVEENWKDYIK